MRRFLSFCFLLLLFILFSSACSGSSKDIPQGNLSVCDIERSLKGTPLTVEGEITFIDESDPAGKYFELSEGNCRVGLFIELESWSKLSADEKSRFTLGNVVKVHGQLTSFQGELVLDFFEIPDQNQEKLVQEEQVEGQETPSLCDLDSSKVGQEVSAKGRIAFVDNSSPDGVMMEVGDASCRVLVFIGKDAWDGFTEQEKDAYQQGTQVEISGVLSSENGELVLEVFPAGQTAGESGDPEMGGLTSICDIRPEMDNEEIKTRGFVTSVDQEEGFVILNLTNFQIQTGYYLASLKYEAGVCRLGVEIPSMIWDGMPEEDQIAIQAGREVLVNGVLLKVPSIDPVMDDDLALELFGPPEILKSSPPDFSSRVQPGWNHGFNIFDNTLSGLMPGFTAISIGPAAEVDEVIPMLEEYSRDMGINGIPTAGMIAIRNMVDIRTTEAYPELMDSVAIDIDGTPVIDWNLGTEIGIPYVGCILCEGWQDFLKTQARRLINGGVDSIFFDAPDGSLFAARDDVINGDFNPSIMEAFNQYLAENYSAAELADMGITDLSTFNYRFYLINNGYGDTIRAPLDTRWSAPLFPIYYHFLLTATQDVVNDLLTYTREYAREKGREDLVITLNCNDLSPTLYHFIDEVNHCFSEYYYLDNYPNLNRGTPNMRIMAALGKSSEYLPGTVGSVPVLFDLQTTNLLDFLIAEAYANGFNFQAPSGYAGSIQIGEVGENIIQSYVGEMEHFEAYYDFISTHRECCETTETVADVTLVYHLASDLESFEYREQFTNASQALLDNNIQYNVLILRGDSHNGEITTGVVILPDTTSPLSPYEEDLLKDSLQIEFSDHTNSQALSLQIQAVLDPILTVDQDGLEGYVFATGDGYVINLLNQTYDVHSESLIEFENIAITMQIPGNLDVSDVSMASPDTLQEIDLEYQQNGQVLSFTVPSLWVWDMIFIQ